MAKPKDVLLEAIKEAHDALADVINASDNGAAYSPEELRRDFLPIVNRLYELIKK